MLVLTRKTNERIQIGDDVEIVVIDIKGDHVKLGVEAPRRLPVFRKEVYEAIKAENLRAADVPRPERLDRLKALLGVEEPSQAGQ
jgi:carbon storage regulator